MNQSNLRQDYANSNWDIRHRFVGTITYTMPQLRKFGSIGNYALGNWHANAIVTMQGGFPFNVSITDDRAHVLGIGTQRPNWVSAGSSSCSTSTRINNTTCITRSAYAIPTLGTFGTVHRNDLHGPKYVVANISLFKDFPMYQQVKMQIRAEAFNAFNRANIGNPNSTLPSISSSTGTFNFTGSNFGTVSSMANGYSPRMLQLAAKVIF
jgi:hypothetical protein